MSIQFVLSKYTSSPLEANQKPVEHSIKSSGRHIANQEAKNNGVFVCFGLGVFINKTYTYERAEFPK